MLITIKTNKGLVASDIEDFKFTYKGKEKVIQVNKGEEDLGELEAIVGVKEDYFLDYLKSHSNQLIME